MWTGATTLGIEPLSASIRPPRGTMTTQSTWKSSTTGAFAWESTSRTSPSSSNPTPPSTARLACGELPSISRIGSCDAPGQDLEPTLFVEPPCRSPSDECRHGNRFRRQHRRAFIPRERHPVVRTYELRTGSADSGRRRLAALALPTRCRAIKNNGQAGETA